jgi:hypothetical protein
MIVEIRFTGLCAFVRNTNRAAMRVILIEPSSAPCDKHEPVLLVPDSYWDQAINRRQPSDSFFDEDYQEVVHVLPLDQEDLVFPAGSIALSLLDPGSLPDCPIVRPKSFDWIAHISEFTGNGAMRDAVLTDTAPAGVASRIRMTSGEFSTLEFRRNGSMAGARVIKYGFIFNGVLRKRALAEEILMTDYISTTIYEISANSFGGEANDPINLTEKDGLLGFKVVDLPLEKIKNPASAKLFARDDCFAEFYALGSASGDVPVPLQADLCPPSAGGGLSNPKCPSALFDDNNHA